MKRVQKKTFCIAITPLLHWIGLDKICDFLFSQFQFYFSFIHLLFFFIIATTVKCSIFRYLVLTFFEDQIYTKSHTLLWSLFWPHCFT